MAISDPSQPHWDPRHNQAVPLDHLKHMFPVSTSNVSSTAACQPFTSGHQSCRHTPGTAADGTSGVQARRPTLGGKNQINIPEQQLQYGRNVKVAPFMPKRYTHNQITGRAGRCETSYNGPGLRKLGRSAGRSGSAAYLLPEHTARAAWDEQDSDELQNQQL